MADAAGTTVWKWEQQEPFGNNVPDENPSGLGAFDLPLRLPGQYYDKETGLHYNMARDYWPDGGRYLQPDPLGVLLTSGATPTISLNHLYSYVGANPLALVDPTGEQPSNAFGSFLCKAECVVKNIWPNYKCLQDARNCADRCSRKFPFDITKQRECEQQCFGSDFEQCRKPYLDCIG